MSLPKLKLCQIEPKYTLNELFPVIANLEEMLKLLFGANDVTIIVDINEDDLLT